MTLDIVQVAWVQTEALGLLILGLAVGTWRLHLDGRAYRREYLEALRQDRQ